MSQEHINLEDNADLEIDRLRAKIASLDSLRAQLAAARDEIERRRAENDLAQRISNGFLRRAEEAEDMLAVAQEEIAERSATYESSSFYKELWDALGGKPGENYPTKWRWILDAIELQRSDLAEARAERDQLKADYASAIRALAAEGNRAWNEAIEAAANEIDLLPKFNALEMALTYAAGRVRALRREVKP